MQSTNFDDPQFSFEEACAVSHVNPVTLRSWMARGTAAVGTKHPKLHRWLFSGIDIIRLRVMGDLVATCGMPPSTVAQVADTVIARYRDMSRRDAQTDLLQELQDGVRKELRIMVSLVDGEFVTAESTWTGDTYSTPLPSRGSWAERFRRPHVIVPADTIILDVLTALCELLREDHAA